MVLVPSAPVGTSGLDTTVRLWSVHGAASVGAAGRSRKKAKLGFGSGAASPASVSRRQADVRNSSRLPLDDERYIQYRLAAFSDREWGVRGGRSFVCSCRGSPHSKRSHLMPHDPSDSNSSSLGSIQPLEIPYSHILVPVQHIGHAEPACPSCAAKCPSHWAAALQLTQLIPVHPK